MSLSVVGVPKQSVYGLIKRNHYLKRLPPISFAFSLYDKLELKGVCTFGVPAGKDLCVGLCGEQYKDEVLELNRLFLTEKVQEIMRALRNTAADVRKDALGNMAATERENFIDTLIKIKSNLSNLNE